MDESFTEMSFEVFRDDVMLLYTDCLNSSCNEITGKSYGNHGIMNALKDAPRGSAKEILDYVVKDFYDFIDIGNPDDDLTVIVLKRNKNG